MFRYKRIEKILKGWKQDSGISHDKKIMYNFNPLHNELTIYFTYPGYLVGRGGLLFDKYESKLKEERVTKITFVEVADYVI